MAGVETTAKTQTGKRDLMLNCDWNRAVERKTLENAPSLNSQELKQMKEFWQDSDVQWSIQERKGTMYVFCSDCTIYKLQEPLAVQEKTDRFCELNRKIIKLFVELITCPKYEKEVLLRQVKYLAERHLQEERTP